MKKNIPSTAGKDMALDKCIKLSVIDSHRAPDKVPRCF